jgi:hypothetical protein
MRRRTATVLVVVVALLLAGAYAVNQKYPFFGSKAKDGTHAVTPDGGTFMFPSGLGVIVPKGAVDAETKLTASVPAALSKSDAGPFKGLRSAGVVFDVTLTQGDQQVQPKLPVELTIPMESGSSFRPSAAQTGSVPLAYTPSGEGGFLLLPAKLQDRKILRVTAAHLSPKYVAYVTDDALLESFFPETVKTDPAKCQQQVTASGEKIKFGNASRGWSLKSDSAIFACLYPGKDGYVRVGVANRIDYILTVAATQNVRVVASRGNLEEEITKYVAGLLPGGEKIKAYLGRDAELVGSININDLPSTIEFQGDFRTFAAQSTIKVLGLAVGILTGDGNVDQNLKLLELAFKTQGLVSCVQDSIGPLTGSANLGQVASAGAGCFSPLFEAIAGQIDLGKVLWRIPWMADALKGIVDTAISSMNGVKLTLADTLRVEVVKVPPPCPTGASLHDALITGIKRALPGTGATDVWNTQVVACADGWAWGVTDVGTHDPQTDTITAYLIHYESGKWVVKDAGQDMGASPYCKTSEVPFPVRKNLSCYIS